MTILQQSKEKKEQSNVIIDEFVNQNSNKAISDNDAIISNLNRTNQNTYRKIFMPILQPEQAEKNNEKNSISVISNNNISTSKSKIPVLRYNSPTNKYKNSIKLYNSKNNAQNEISLSNNKNQQQQNVKQQLINNGSYHAFRSNSRNTNNSRIQENDYLLLQQRHANNNNSNNKKSDSPVQIFNKNIINNTMKPNKIQFQTNKFNSIDQSSNNNNNNNNINNNNKLQISSNLNYNNNNGKILINKNTATRLVRRSKSISDDKVQNMEVNNGYQNNNTSSNYSSCSSLYSSSSSSCSSIINLIEETQNIYDFIYLIKKYLKKIELSYSIDDLYMYLKENVKYNGYRNFTIDFLQTYLNKYENVLSQVQIASINSNNKKVKRSLTQVKTTSNQNYPNQSPYFLAKHVSKYDMNGRSITNKNLRSIEKFFIHFNLIKKLFDLVQRDILFKILITELPQNKNNIESPDIYRPASRSLKNLSQSNSQHQQLIGSTSTNNLTNHNNNKHSNKDSNLLVHLRKCQLRLYDLNERLDALLNDSSNCDLKLLSSNSQLPFKYEYFKHGEFILRLTTDLISKLRLALLLSERFFNLSYKLNGNYFFIQSTNNNLSITKKEADLINAMAKLNNHTNNFEDELEEEYLELDSIDNDIKNKNNFEDEYASSSVLKNITRIKNQNKLGHQKLPKINKKLPDNELSSNRDEMNENYYKSVNKEETNNKTALTTNTGLNSFGNTNSNSSITNPTTANLILLKQDTNDSFIQDTDCSSILSEEDSVYYNTNELNLLKQIKNQNKNNDSVQSNYVIQPLNNKDKLIEEYKLIKLQIETTNQSINDLDIYLQGLINRADHYTKLKEQLKSDQELIRKTKSSLKLYSSNVENKKILKTNSNEHEVFKIKLQKQLGYLQYRYGVTLQDLKNEQVYYTQIDHSIIETQTKLKNLNLKLDELNKYLVYIESLLNKNSSNMFYVTNNKTNSKLENNQLNKLENAKSDSKLSNNNYNAIPKILPPLQPSQTSIHPVSINSNINSNDYYK